MTQMLMSKEITDLHLVVDHQRVSKLRIMKERIWRSLTVGRFDALKWGLAKGAIYD